MSSNEGLQQVTRLVNTFLNRPDTLAFRTPVDPKAMNIPDYFQIVKNPMDLGTVRAALRSAIRIRFGKLVVKQYSHPINCGRTQQCRLLPRIPCSNVGLPARDVPVYVCELLGCNDVLMYP